MQNQLRCNDIMPTSTATCRVHLGFPIDIKDPAFYSGRNWFWHRSQLWKEPQAQQDLAPPIDGRYCLAQRLHLLLLLPLLPKVPQIALVVARLAWANAWVGAKPTTRQITPSKRALRAALIIGFREKTHSRLVPPIQDKAMFRARNHPSRLASNIFSTPL